MLMFFDVTCTYVPKTRDKHCHTGAKREWHFSWKPLIDICWCKSQTQHHSSFLTMGYIHLRSHTLVLIFQLTINSRVEVANITFRGAVFEKRSHFAAAVPCSTRYANPQAVAAASLRIHVKKNLERNKRRNCRRNEIFPVLHFTCCDQSTQTYSVNTT